MNPAPIPTHIRRAAWRTGLALLLAYAWLAGGEALADVVVTPAPGASFQVNGPVVLPAVPGAAQQAQAVCINAGGQLGPCGASSGGGSYTAGTGLAVTPGGQFSIAPGYQLPQGCAGSQAVQWSGSAWVCVTPTSVGSLPACSKGEVLRFGDGGVECGVLPNTITTLGQGDGQHASIAIGANGLPIISHYNPADTDLKVTICTNAACSGTHTHTTHSLGDMGQYSAIAIGVDGRPVISYHDATDGDLRAVQCSNSDCTGAGATHYVLDSAGTVGTHTAIAIDADGLPVISYRSVTDQSLKFARCADAACSSAAPTTVDSAGDVGYYGAVAIGSDGLPIISYFDNTNTALKVAHCGNAACTTATRRTVDDTGDMGRHSRIAIGTDGRPVIAYRDWAAGVKVAHCNDNTCASATFAPVNGTPDADRISMALGAHGFPVISFNGAGHRLHMARCLNAGCSAATVHQVSGDALDAAAGTAIAVGADGLPVISYRAGGADLHKVVKCSSPACREP